MEYENEVEIDLFRMLFKACMKWRIIVVTAIVAAFVVGGVKISMNIASISDEETLEKMNSDYETKVTAYKAEGKQLERSIEESSRNLQIQMEYNQSSLLMQIDPYNEWRGSANLYVDTGYQIMPGTSIQNENPAYKIVYAYSDYAGSGEFYAALQSKLSFKLEDIKYLKEVFGVQVDGGRYAITVSAVADTEAHCRELIAAAKDILLEERGNVEKQIAKHTLNATDVTVYSQINTDRENFQIGQKTREVELELQLSSYQTKYLDWEEREKDIKVPILDMGHAIRNGIKFFLLAGVGVGVFMGVIYCLGYIFSAKVQGTENLPPAIHRIGEIPRESAKKATVIDRMFLRMFGIIVKCSERDTRVAASAQHIVQLLGKACADGDREVAFVSDLPMEQLQALTAEIEKAAGGFEAVAAGNILVSPEASSAAAASSAVVLVVGEGISVRKSVEGMIDQLRAYDKLVLGAIVTNVDAQ